MKKVIALVVAVVLCIGVFAFSMIYRNQKNQEQHQSLQEISTEESSDSQSQSSTGLVIETKDKEYQVYFDGEIVTVKKGDYEIEMKTWQDSFKAEIPVSATKDMDGDGEKELLLRVRTGTNNNDDGTKTTVYAIYMFDPVTTSSGEKTFDTVIANTNTWAEPFGETVRAEVTQLESCKKILQYAMESVENEIVYDKNGLGTGDYVGYAKALSDSKNQYYTYKDWSMGQGVYNLDEDGNITLDIQILVEYEEVEESQIIGFVKCNIQFEDGAFSIVPKQISFEAQEKYKVTDQRERAESDWSVTVNNIGSQPDFQNKLIDWIDCEFDVSEMSKNQNQSFDTLSSKIKCADTVEFTPSSITITAKEGYTFSSNVAGKGSFSVILNSEDYEGVDIAYNCSVKTVDGNSTLVITLDKEYPKSQLEDVEIKFGA